MVPTSVTFAFLLALIATCLAQNDSPAPALSDVLAKTANLSSFSDLLAKQYPDILSVLSAQQDSQQPITILAPSDGAFKRIPNSPLGAAFANKEPDSIRSALQYHILPGKHQSSSFSQTFQFLPTWSIDEAHTSVSSGQRVAVVRQGDSDFVFVSAEGTRSNVEKADIAFTGGTLHIIDMPVVPPQPFPVTAEAFNLTAFVGALYGNNETLAGLINGTSDITIFAPNNLAFQTIGSTVTSISNDSLSELLEYHILISQGGPHYTTSLRNGTTLQSLQGGNVTIREASNSLFINSAKVLQSDLLIANGVMHVVDGVLNPNATGVLPDPAAATHGPAMTGSRIPNVPFTQDIPALSASASGSTTSVSRGASASGSNAVGSRSSTSSSSESAQSTSKNGAVELERNEFVARVLSGVVMMTMISGILL